MQQQPASTVTDDVEAERERLFTLSLDMLCIASSDGYFKRLNPAFSRALGWSLEELMARPFIEFVHPDDHTATLKEVERQVAAGESVLRFENRYRHKDGSWRVLSWRSVPQPGGFMYATARDVTEEHALRAELVKAKEGAEAANRAKSTFLATMSHEIRTPLYGVLGMIDLLSLTHLDSDQRATVEVVRKSGESLQRIIDDILEFSKLEAGRLEIRPEPVSILELLTTVRNAFSGVASSKGLVLQHEVDPRISPALSVDGVRLQQVLSNFVGNALKFTERGRVSIVAELLDRANGTDRVRFAVQDTGIGIAPEDQKRLFEPFAQAERDTNRRFGGTGLGLAISRRLAEQMGGTVELRSQVGKGTTMLVVLPMPIVDPGSLPAARTSGVIDRLRQAPQPPAEPGKAAAARPRVLVLDDHPVIQKVLRAQLKTLGYEADVVETGVEGLKQWESGRYGLILADCHMPVMDGYEFARRLRALESERGGARIPVIACTANALRGESDVCRAAGMDDYLCKPIELADLERALLKWLPS